MPIVFGDVVPNGKFTNLYVYPHDWPTETWDEHLEVLSKKNPSLLPGLPTPPTPAAIAQVLQQYSRASIDGLTDRTMQQPEALGPSWPSYYGWLYQYSGVNPPQFFGSGEVTASCYAALIASNIGGVIQSGDIANLANCHDPGMDPSEEVNVIFSPELSVAYGQPGFYFNQSFDMCTQPQPNGKTIAAYHGSKYFGTNLTVVPTNKNCSGSFRVFSMNLSHEMVELLTDPNAGGYQGKNGEIADQCEPPQSPTVLTTTWGKDVLTKYWSNHDNPPGGSCQPSLDPPAGAQATTEVLDTGPAGIIFGDAYSNTPTVLPAPTIVTTGSTAPSQLVVARLAVVIKTGTVQGNLDNVTDVDVAVNRKSGPPIITNILTQAPFILDGETHSALLSLPRIPAGDIAGITITPHLPGNPGPVPRVWVIEKVALIVSTGAAFQTLPIPPTIRTRMDHSGLPLTRFSGAVHYWQGDTDRLPAGAQAVPVQKLSLVVSTGGGNLRGGGDNCDVTLFYDGKIPPQTLPNVNNGLPWDGWTKHTIDLPLANAGHLHTVQLHTNFVSGCCTDNWNVERVQLVAQTDPSYDGFLVDTDGDGIVDAIDNCPNVPNIGQEDTNYLAEYEQESMPPNVCKHFPNNTCPALDQVPSPGMPAQDLQGFIDGFHEVFLGDVCDPVASTQATQSGTFGSGVQGPCEEIFVTGGTNFSPPPASCEEQENTQLTFQSWTGNAFGTAQPLSGETSPFFCLCGVATEGDPDQQALTCGSIFGNPSGPPCVVANDGSLPGGSVSAGWEPMTERITPPNAPAPLTSVRSAFQERVYGHPDYSTARDWDFLSDLHYWPGLQGTTPFEGVLWSHVIKNSLGPNPAVGTMPACPDRTSGTSCLLSDLNNHYIGMSVMLRSGVALVGTPGPALVFHIGGWFDTGPGDPVWLPWLSLPQGTSGMQVLSLVGTQPSVVTSSFSPSALNLLAGVAAGTSDLLVGDDVATGIRHATTPLAAVVVEHSTTAVQGALRVGYGSPQGVTIAPIENAFDPPDLRAYAAYDTTLYSLHVTQNAASLTALDVQAALYGAQSSTTVSLYGVAPVNPTALVWNGFSRMLYAIDQVAGTHDSRLRLLSIDMTTGQSQLLWQTSSTYHMPTSTFLSVDAVGNLVLGMVGVHEDGKSEVVELDPGGAPLDSGHIHGALILPALGVSAGINAAVVDHSTLPVRAELLPRANLEPGVCGAEWLREHADTKASPLDPLASAALACRLGYEQHHKGHEQHQEGKQHK